MAGRSRSTGDPLAEWLSEWLAEPNQPGNVQNWLHRVLCDRGADDHV